MALIACTKYRCELRCVTGIAFSLACLVMVSRIMKHTLFHDPQTLKAFDSNALDIELKATEMFNRAWRGWALWRWHLLLFYGVSFFTRTSRFM
jgi:hypothetical protein